jgi:hypothetical protein
VYSTCIFCHTSLGKNEAIEHFPVGRRLAFDAAKGRLWAVCHACERWNLSPLEERWEAIEECERLFRDTKLRVSTENIGLARLKEGTTLVRVGEPQRPEMAAWRYGDQFHRRRRKNLALIAAGAVVVGGVVVAGPVMGLIGGGGVGLINGGVQLYRHSTIARLRLNGKVLKLSRMMLGQVSLRTDRESGFSIQIPYKTLRAWWKGYAWESLPIVKLQGAEALDAARRVLPLINRSGARQSQVAEAVGILADSSGPSNLFVNTAASWLSLSEERQRKARWSWNSDGAIGRISLLPPSVRLALEMSLHEDDERRALEGELALLEDRWREAEEVAAISDDMFLPASVDAILKRLKSSKPKDG